MSLRDEIENIINVLSSPLSEEDIETGWDQGLRKKWKDWYENLHENLIKIEPMIPSMSAARAMDFDGVGRTSISHMAARIDNRINRGERY
jgi:hypothetical protein